PRVGRAKDVANCALKCGVFAARRRAACACCCDRFASDNVVCGPNLVSEPAAHSRERSARFALSTSRHLERPLAHPLKDEPVRVMCSFERVARSASCSVEHVSTRRADYMRVFRAYVITPSCRHFHRVVSVLTQPHGDACAACCALVQTHVDCTCSAPPNLH